MKRFFLTTGILLLSLGAQAQRVPVPKDFADVCDTLSALLKERFTVESKLVVNRVQRSGKTLNLTFTNTLSDYPWHKEDQDWFKAQLKEEMKNVTKDYSLGRILTRSFNFEELITPHITTDGNPSAYNITMPDPRNLQHSRYLERVGEKKFKGGMTDRYIALWQSHGRYYNEEEDNWRWQRAPLHRTVEDMFTQSFVLPFLIPMLENAGAYVLTPRERDTHRLEYIIDNDKAFIEPRTGDIRRSGTYTEKGHWSSAGEGFADKMLTYKFQDNPFLMGTARSTTCSGGAANATATWTADIQERGHYAVYISYGSADNANPKAHYTVEHMGGKTEFSVNQQIGAGTWMYLGTFEFDKGSSGRVILDNRGSQDYVVLADAVKIGGGMGKLQRGGSTSGVPSYAEGAHYWMQWAGADTTVTRGWETDYTNDFATRGAWTEWMKKEKGVPFDLSLAFHTDAGLHQADSTVGTLAIYSYLWDGKKKFEDGRSRMASRLLAEYVQDEVVKDLRANYDPDWNRRELWDRSYSESRTTGVPGMILEVMSHQNFADMKYGLDPSVRFSISRSVYKGMLKTLSAFYKTPYVVQPLPVNSFSARFTSNNTVSLKWKPTPDDAEPTAMPESYFVYMRIDGGAFNAGSEIRGTEVQMTIEPGHVYSYKVVACNAGGLSFPSEILSVGRAASAGTEVAIVNNFYRVSAPDWVDTPEYAGFEGRLDNGVPYLTDISYIGENYEYRRNAEYEDDDYPGFGASLTDHACETVAGNSFDYPYVHGKSLLSLGYSFSSMSKEAFCDNGADAPVVDLICGKQKTTVIGRGAVDSKYEVFPQELQEAIRAYTAQGGNLLLSGSEIGSDCQGSFTSDVLGYKCKSYFGTGSTRIGDFEFYNRQNPYEYCVEAPDALSPAGIHSKTFIKYKTSGTSAGVVFKTKAYRVVSLGVPIEVIKSEKDREELLRMSLQALQTN